MELFKGIGRSIVISKVKYQDEQYYAFLFVRIRNYMSSAFFLKIMVSAPRLEIYLPNFERIYYLTEFAISGLVLIINLLVNNYCCDKPTKIFIIMN